MRSPRIALLAAVMLALCSFPRLSARAEDAPPPDRSGAAGEPASEALSPPAAAPAFFPRESDDGSAAETLTLGACVREAYEHHPELRGARAAIERADDEARAVRGGYLPTITVEGNVLLWDDDMAATLGGGAAPPPLVPPGPGELPESGFDQYVAGQLAQLGEVLAAMGAPAPIKMRDQVTWGATVRATQALTPLYQVFEGHRARLAQAAGARAHARTVRQDIALGVATAYYGALQANAYVAIAASAVEQLETHLFHVRAFFQQGLVGRNDVLKVEVELANARRQQIDALTGRAIARASLAVAMGRSARKPVIPAAQPPAERLPPAPVSPEEAAIAAGRERTELWELDDGLEAAEHAARASWGGLIPKVALVGQYDHVGGQGPFVLKDTFFAGVMLSWDVWDWGKTIYEAKAADGRAEELRARRERLAQLLELDATAKRYRLQSAADGFQLARMAITQAEEALRIERERFAVLAATTTDLLDAESALIRARAAYANTWYAWLLARAELERAMGRAEAIGAAEGGDG